MVALRARVPEAMTGERFDRALSLLAGCSRSASAELIGAGRARLDGRPETSVKARISGGAELEVELPDPGDSSVQADPGVGRSLVIVHEDPDLVVIDKPAGLVVHPGAGNRNGTLVNGMVSRFPEVAMVGEPGRPGVVHRLDKGTSGLMVVARSQLGYQGLVRQMAAHEVARTYVALVSGRVRSPAGTVDGPIGRSRRDPTVMGVVRGGKPARTRYRLVADLELGEAPVSLLELTLETGRTHQVRAHMSAMGHPLVGDHRYGWRGPGTGRPFLHSSRLELTHPRTNGSLGFTSALPGDLVALLREAGLPEAEAGLPEAG
ncbi:MAG: RluA family pseudouridine synthase [Acidimicrobiales bacterium]